jgi:hypothetical protein
MTSYLVTDITLVQLIYRVLDMAMALRPKRDNNKGERAETGMHFGSCSKPEGMDDRAAHVTP